MKFLMIGLLVAMAVTVYAALVVGKKADNDDDNNIPPYSGYDADDFGI